MSNVNVSPLMLLGKQLVFIFGIIGNTLCDNIKSYFTSLHMVLLIDIVRF